MIRSEPVRVCPRPKPGQLASSGLLGLLLASPQLAGAVSAPTTITNVAPTSVARPASINLPTVPDAGRQAVPLQRLTGLPAVIGSDLMTPQAMAQTACFPTNPTLTTGLLPLSMSQSSGLEALLPIFGWGPARGGLNYVVQRALDAPNATWSLVASTCGGGLGYVAALGSKSYDQFSGELFGRIVDASPGLFPGATYLYTLTAVNGANQTQWLAFRWTAPRLAGAQFSGLVRNGAVVLFGASYDSAQIPTPSQIVVGASNGYAASFRPNAHAAVGLPANCVQQPGATLITCPVQLQAGMGPVRLTLTTQWSTRWGGVDHVVAQSVANASLP
jgi:hypothetical protein